MGYDMNTYERFRDKIDDMFYQYGLQDFFGSLSKDTYLMNYLKAIKDDFVYLNQSFGETKKIARLLRSVEYKVNKITKR
jgi:hypothetical protein